MEEREAGLRLGLPARRADRNPLRAAGGAHCELRQQQFHLRDPTVSVAAAAGARAAAAAEAEPTGAASATSNAAEGRTRA